MHVAHGALTRSLRGLAEDKIVVKSAWIVLASLSSSAGQLRRAGSLMDSSEHCICQLEHASGAPRTVVEALWDANGIDI